MLYDFRVTKNNIPEGEKEDNKNTEIGSRTDRILMKKLLNRIESLKQQKESTNKRTEKVIVVRKTKEGIRINGENAPLERLETDVSRAVVVNDIPSVDILGEGDCFIIRRFSDTFKTIIIRNGMVPYPETDFKLYLKQGVESEAGYIEPDETITGGGTLGPYTDEYLTIDLINRLCSILYREMEKKIVVIVFARYELDKVKKIVRNHYTHWNNATGKGVDFFWLGYGNNKNPGTKVQDGKDISEMIVFNDTLYQKDMEKLIKSDLCKYGDRIALLLLDCNYGRLRYENHLYLDIEAIAQLEDDSKLKSFFSYLIKSCKEKNQIADVELELFARRLVSSLGDINIYSIIGFIGSVLGIIGFIFK